MLMPLMSTDIRARYGVLVIDDHPLFRKGIISIIDECEHFEVIGAAGDGKDGLTCMRQKNPDLIILDISMPGHNGVELLKMMKAERPGTPILVLTVHDEVIYAVRALKAGARGYILKGESGEEILSGMSSIMRGELYLSHQIKHRIIFQAIEALDAGQDFLLQKLTRREREVFDLLGDGLNSADIADWLKLSAKTVDTHRLHIREKLLCKNAAEVAEFAAQWKLYSEQEVTPDTKNSTPALTC